MTIEEMQKLPQGTYKCWIRLNNRDSDFSSGSTITMVDIDLDGNRWPIRVMLSCSLLKKRAYYVTNMGRPQIGINKEAIERIIPVEDLLQSLEEIQNE